MRSWDVHDRTRQYETPSAWTRRHHNVHFRPRTSRKYLGPLSEQHVTKEHAFVRFLLYVQLLCKGRNVLDTVSKI